MNSYNHALIGECLELDSCAWVRVWFWTMLCFDLAHEWHLILGIDLAG